jgi:hypothetical protein
VFELITGEVMFGGLAEHELYEQKWKVATGKADFAADTVR